jgi:hypothetical protein
MSKRVYCFAANEAGVHGTGTAKVAYEKHGARWGKSYGHVGDSFAIPTKSEVLEPLPPDRIGDYILGFLAYARGHRRWGSRSPGSATRPPSGCSRVHRTTACSTGPTTPTSATP